MDKTWNAAWVYRTAKTGDGWQAELAIAWSELNMTMPAPGTAWRFNLAHDDAGADSANVSSWAPVTKNFHAVDQYATARFGGLGLAGGLDSFEVENGQPKLTIRGSNGSDKEQVLSFDVNFEGQNAPVTGSVSVPAGKSATASVTPRVRIREVVSARIELRTADKTLIQRNKVPIAKRYKVAVTVNNQMFQGFVEAGIQGPADTTGQTNWQMLKESADGETVLEGRTALTDGAASLRIKTDTLANGPYVLKLTSDIPERDISEVRYVPLVKAGRPPFFGTDAGESDEPVAPYTPMRVKGDRVFCLLRTYEFADRFLPSQVVSSGANILAAPMRLVATAGDHSADLGAIPQKSMVTTPTGHRVETEAAGTVFGLGVEATSWMEEDGFWWVTVRISPDQRRSIDKLVLELPVRREVAQYFHPADGSWKSYSARLSYKGWEDQFWPIMSLVNMERGISWYCESAKGWLPSTGNVMRIDVEEGKTATLRCTLIGQSTELDAPLEYSFGLQGLPVKPIPADWREAHILHGAAYGMEEPGAAAGAHGSLSYDAEEAVSLAEGTIEATIRTDFDPAVKVPEGASLGTYNSAFLTLANADGQPIAMLYWNIQVRGWRFNRYSSDGKFESTVATNRDPWQEGKGTWRRVALTWGDAVRIYDNGTLVAEEKSAGLLKGREQSLKGARLVLGAFGGSASTFSLGQLRVLKTALAPEQLAKAEELPSTTIDEDFAGLTAKSDKTAAGGVLQGEAGVVADGDRTFVRLHPPEGAKTPSTVERFADNGVKTLIYHQRWTLNYGAPYTRTNGDRLKRLVTACHDNGIKLLLYVGYGLGDMADESKLYHDYWAAHPVIRWTSRDGDPRQAFTRTCQNCQLWTDFQLHYLRESLREFDFDGFYYDGTISPMGCRNTSHGCGFVDENGAMRRTFPILATRRYSKRLYALCKEYRKGNHIDCHTSANLYGIRTAWVDSLWNGEQFQSMKPGFHLDLDYFRSQCYAQQYGAPSQFLVYSGRPFNLPEALSFTLLHDVRDRARGSGNNWTLIPQLWKIQERFDMADSLFLPYWDNAEYLKIESEPAGHVWDEAGMASLWLHPGKRALVVISNIQDDKAQVTARLYLPRMGLAETASAYDAETGETVTMKDGTVTLSLDGYRYRLVWIE
jgi:hypothetical protein